MTVVYSMAVRDEKARVQAAEVMGNKNHILK